MRIQMSIAELRREAKMLREIESSKVLMSS